MGEMKHVYCEGASFRLRSSQEARHKKLTVRHRAWLGVVAADESGWGFYVASPEARAHAVEPRTSVVGGKRVCAGCLEEVHR